MSPKLVWASSVGVLAVAVVVWELQPALSNPDVASADQQVAAALRWMEQHEDWMTVPPEHGRFLWQIVEATRPRRILEVGSAFGYATLWLGRGLLGREGNITSIELLEERVEIARQALERAGLSARVRVITGDAFEVVPTLSGQFDLIFLDAAKADYHRFYEMLLPRLREGGVLLAHNVIARARQVRPFLDRIESDKRVIASIIRIGDDGFAFCVRRRGKESQGTTDTP